MIIIPGPVQIHVGNAICTSFGGTPTVSLADMKRLGQTENGVQISISNKAHRVNVDDMGGSQGAPAELIYLGSSASIRGVLVDYGDPHADGINEDARKMLWGIGRGLRYVDNDPHSAKEGDISAPGTPLFEYGYGFSMLFIGVGMSYFFPKCEFSSQPREWNVSGLERKTSFNATAYEIVCKDSMSAEITSANDKRLLYITNPTLEGGSSADSITYSTCRTTTHDDVTKPTAQ